jgi:hypothetical protein
MSPTFWILKPGSGRRRIRFRVQSGGWRLRREEIQSDVRRAEAQRTLTETQLQRLEKLATSNAIAKTQLDEARGGERLPVAFPQVTRKLWRVPASPIGNGTPELGSSEHQRRAGLW